LRSESHTTVLMPDVIVSTLALQLQRHPEAQGELRATDGDTVIHVGLTAGRITVTTLEGPDKGSPPREFSVLRLSLEQVCVMGRAYRSWIVAQARVYGLQEPLWE